MSTVAGQFPRSSITGPMTGFPLIGGKTQPAPLSVEPIDPSLWFARVSGSIATPSRSPQLAATPGSSNASPGSSNASPGPSAPASDGGCCG